ncbi:hypothetical protein PFISCL1PPCAC_13347 [Pristionchus fissidentatus]|uniref:Uncharacterized protein n=1 Tax=Pristionchus fissidentatus TaxID=1538716 RepID=A0AAV5VVF7_9BILA|nr:hypothetical protein PFISCL1PPCAC_13347 [Pristionchus fissidentatus]
MENVVLISDLVFIKRGVAKSTPDKVEIDQEQLKELLQGSTSDASDDEDEVKDGDEEMDEKAEPAGDGVKTVEEEMDDEEEALKELMKEYEKEETEGETGPKMAGIAMFANPKDDPYITNHDDSDEEDEKDDFIIRPDDNLIVAAKVDKGQYSLEVRVYNEACDDFYVHHDYLLEAPPLCLEPFYYDPGSDNKQGNLLAVGTMSGSLEVWDLDIVNSVDPVLILEAEGQRKKKKKKGGRKKRDGTAQGHIDAVLSCRWNQSMPHVLASGDAAGILVLWDIDEAKPATVIDATAQGGIQSMNWHPVESSVLLTGSMGGFVDARDCRSDKIAAQWNVGADVQVEKVIWDHFSPFHAVVASDDGKLRYLDMRNAGAFVHEGMAHEGGVEAVGMSCATKGLMATGGADGTLALWSLSSSHLKEVHRTNISLGSIHSLAFSPNSPMIVCVGGDEEDLTRIVDLSKYEQVVSAFA